MIYRMKNFNIFGVHWKIQLLGVGRGVLRNQYIGCGLPKKGGGLGQFADLKGGLARKRGGGLIPQCPLWKIILWEILLEKILSMRVLWEKHYLWEWLVIQVKNVHIRMFMKMTNYHITFSRIYYFNKGRF